MIPIALAFALLATPLQAAGPIPAGFKPTSGPELTQRNDDSRTADYMVTLVGDKLRVETRVDWVKRTTKEAALHRSLHPPKVSFRDDMARIDWSPGDGVQVDGGWLWGYDVGEFGGGLYWFAPDGKSHLRLDHRNTPILAKTSKGLFAVQALTHMMFWYSELVEVTKGATGWTSRRITDLHVTPRQIIQVGDRFVYTAANYVSTLETDGSQHEIYRSWPEPGFESMVRRTNGEIWIGAATALLRLTPKANGDYSSQWFMKTHR